MALKPCLTCQRPTRAGSYCKACKRWPESPGRLRGRQWQDLRARVLEAFGHRCSACGESGVPLEVHHLDHDHLNNAPSNLRPLCRRCHARVGARRR